MENQEILQQILHQVTGLGVQVDMLRERVGRIETRLGGMDKRLDGILHI